jgi:hypothetical protein
MARFPGLGARFEELLEALSHSTGADAGPVAADIGCLSGSLEARIRARALEPGRLTPTVRGIRGWLAFFAEGGNLDAYLAAMRVLQAGLREIAGRRLRGPFTIHLRPMNGLMRLRGDRSGTRLHLPAAVVGLSAAELIHCADLAAGRPRARARVMDALMQPACHAVRERMLALGGEVDGAAGRWHDLGRLFAALNRDHFGERLERPRLGWSARPSLRKLGHYDPLHDRVVLSAALDRAEVPEYVVSYVLYHELLHKHHGVRVEDGTVRAHTPAFRRDERRYPRHAEAERFLSRLGRSLS